MLTTGATLEAAFARASQLEELARLYVIALSVGRPAILSDEEVLRIGERQKAGGADIDARLGPSGGTNAAAKRPSKSKRIAGKRHS